MNTVKILLITAAILFSGATEVFPAQVYTVGGEGESAVKTITEGVAKLRTGDTLAITPGRYHESIKIPCDDITIIGTAPGVILDGSIEVTASEFQPVDGRKGVFAFKLPKSAPTWRYDVIPWMWFNGIMLISSKTPLGPEKNQMSFYVSHRPKLLELNIDGKSIPADAKIVIPVVRYLIDIGKHKNIRIRGLQFTRCANFAIYGRAAKNVRIEYCWAYWCGGGFFGGSDSYLARNTATLCNASGIRNSSNSTIEENLVVATRLGWDARQRWAGTMKTNAVSRCLWRRNWIMDEYRGGLTRAGHRSFVRIWKFSSGLWPDINCYDNAYINNAIARLGHAGIYLEYTAKRNTAMFNAIQDCSMGITVRQGSQNLVTRNWVWDRDYLGWGKVNTESYCAWGQGYDEITGKPLTEFQNHAMWGRQYLEGLNLWHAYDGMYEASRDNVFIGNLVQVSGRAVSVPFAQVKLEAQPAKKDKDGGLVPVDPKKVWVPAPWPDEKQRSALVPPRPLSNRYDLNYYDRPANDKDFAWLGDHTAGDFKQFQKETGWELNGKLGRFTTKTIGLEPLWTLCWAALDRDTPVAILHDPTFETPSAPKCREPLFWRASHMRPGYAMRAPATAWQLARKQEPEGRNGGLCLYILGTTKQKKRSAGKVTYVPFEETIGWTSASVPVKPGTTMGLDFWMKCVDVKPGENSNGVLVTMNYTDACGFSVGRKVVVGKGGDEKHASGSYEYTNIKAESKVPEGACWMNVFLGLEPSEGKVLFDDCRINLVDPAPPSFDKRK